MVWRKFGVESQKARCVPINFDVCGIFCHFFFFRPELALCCFLPVASAGFSNESGEPQGTAIRSSLFFSRFFFFFFFLFRRFFQFFETLFGKVGRSHASKTSRTCVTARDSDFFLCSSFFRFFAPTLALQQASACKMIASRNF